DVLVDLKRDLRVGKALEPRVADLDLQELGNLLRQRAVGASGEDLELLAAGGRQCACRYHADTIGMVGAGGFEPPNTGSKAPRLTAWPRPSRAREANYKRLSVTDLRFTGNRLRAPLVLGARERPGHEGPCAITGQRFNGTLGREAAPEQPEYGRAAARHGRGRRAEVAQLLLERPDFLMPPHDRRLQVIDHLCGARRPRDGQQLELAVLALPRGAIVVVPGIGFRRRHAEGRPHDDDEVRRQIDERIDLFPAPEPQ